MTENTALIQLGLGIVGLYITGRNRFNRRNGAGVEQFDTYDESLMVAMGERLARLLCWGLVFFGTAGLYSNPEKPKKPQAVASKKVHQRTQLPGKRPTRELQAVPGFRTHFN